MNPKEFIKRLNRAFSHSDNPFQKEVEPHKFFSELVILDEYLKFVKETSIARINQNNDSFREIINFIKWVRKRRT